MSTETQFATRESAAARLRGSVSACASLVAILLIAATYLLLSPPDKPGYAGAIEWRPGSVLKRITDAMSLWGSARTSQGVEIKDFAFYLASAIGLFLLACRAAISGLSPPEHRTGKGSWFFGQGMLVGWVAVSAASATWAHLPDLALGQAAVYGLAVAWAVALCWTLESRDLPRTLWGYATASAVGAALCVWYYYERNPVDRPGFPIGNPAALAGCILPGITLALYTLVGAVVPTGGASVSRRWVRVAASGALLVPLLWCFCLAQSRGAIAGLIIGMAGLLFILATRRMRVVLVVASLVAAAGAVWFFSIRTQDLAMARGATIRFRIYAWQYAANLWNVRPISGHGAGAYPLLAGQEGVKDRALDPAAFMGDAVEHAHNELFEVFTEIGLIGGLTFVGGFLATLAAASALLQANLSPERRWLLYGLVAGVIGLMADAMFGVGLRLPGVPAVFYTLIGVLWSASRAMSRRRPTAVEQTESWLHRLVLRRYGVAACALVAAMTAGWLAVRNWSGARELHAAETALTKRDFYQAVARADTAEARLLDPVRRLIAADLGVRARAEHAVQRFHDLRAWAQMSASAPAAIDLRAAWDDAVQAAQSAFAAAVSMNQRAPTFGRSAGLAAQSAEILAALYRGQDDSLAAHWTSQALTGWATQQRQRPFDATTLLALARHRVDDPQAVGIVIGLLRDALRGGPPPPGWTEVFQRVARHPLFVQTLDDMYRATRTYGPASDTDALILSGAAEMRRIYAIWLASRGDLGAAQAECAEAAALYRAIRSRFPTLEATALAEQAEFAFRADPANPRAAIELAERALRALPVVSAPKRVEMERPIREQLRRYREERD